MKDFRHKILTDIKVELSDEFDRNFERKAFFGKKWKDRRHKGKGTLLVATGKHNEGGTITVTAKMKRYFWAKYHEAGGKIKYKKSGVMSKSSQRASDEAEFYKALALMKVGTKITIPERRFIGDSPEVSKCVETVVKENLKETIEQMVRKRR